MLGKQRLTRRRIAALSGATLALGAGGLSMVPRTAQAQVTMGELNVPDVEFTPKDNALHAVWVLLDGEWSYTNLSADPAAWQVYLLVDDPQNSGNWQAIGIAEGSPSGTDDSGTFVVRGDLTAGPYTSDDFDVSDGEAVTMTVPVGAMLVIRDGSGDIVADAEVHTTADVTVRPGGASASLGGSGQFVAQDNSDSATPTLAGDA